MTTAREFLTPILEDDSHNRSRALDRSIAQVTYEAQKAGSLHGSSYLFERRRIYEEDIASRKEALLSIVRRSLPRLRDGPTAQVLSDLKEIARDSLGHHVDKVQQQLYELDRSFKINLGDTLDLGKDRVLSSIDRELELLVESPASPVDLSMAPFVNLARLEELRQIKSAQFDVCRLIRFCEELNVAFQSSSFHSVAMLTRAILDHIPPIFGFDSFTKVANQYRGSKSFRDIARNLDDSTRKVADAHLHEQIRKREVLPNQQQVDAHQSLDFILAEVVRLLSSA
jgi:hypothetical protein